jgi:hypothetical protein
MPTKSLNLLREVPLGKFALTNSQASISGVRLAKFKSRVSVRNYLDGYSYKPLSCAKCAIKRYDKQAAKYVLFGIWIRLNVERETGSQATEE